MPEISSSRKCGLMLLLFVTLLLPSGAAPVMESTEARYAEIAWEMVRSGNYLEPHFNGIKHFHKPPLTYWLVAAGYRIFGENNFGARFFGVVAACLAVFFLFKLAKVLLKSEREALTATLVFSSSILFLAVSRIVATDIYLTCFTIASQYYLFNRLRGDQRATNTAFYAIALGLGFLTKGPVIFLFTLLPFFVARFVSEDHRVTFSGREVLLAVGLFGALAFPWYIAISIKNPGLFQYFFQVQTVERVFTNRFRRDEPAWFFIAIFLSTFFPYALFFLKGVYKCRSASLRTGTALIYVAIPFLVFSLSRSKQETYILPFYGMAAIVVADVLASFEMRKLKALACFLLVPVALAPAAAGFVYKPLWDYRFLLAVFSVPASGLLWFTYRRRQGEGFVFGTAALLLLFSTAALLTMIIAAPQMKWYERMVARMDALDPDRRLEVLVYHGFLPSISFYRGKLATMAFGMEREVQFEENDTYQRHYITSDQQLAAFMEEQKELFVVASKKVLPLIAQNYPFACTEVFAQRKHTAYFCRRAESARGALESAGQGSSPKVIIEQKEL